MGLNSTKPVFRASNKARLAKVSLDKANNKGTDKTQECAGWSVPLLFANPEDRSSQVKAHVSRS